MTRRPDTTRAFTLIELVVVVAILGVLAAAAAPRWGEGIARRRLDAAADRVAADLELARRLARTQRRPATVSFDTTTASYGIGGVRDPLTRRDSYQVPLGDAPYRVELRDATFGGDGELVFDAWGEADSTGSITIANPAGTRTISLGGASAAAEAAGGS